MKVPEAVAVIRKLRCVDCLRAPTEAEVKEMRESFGHKLKPGDGSGLVWRCLSCGKGN